MSSATASSVNSASTIGGRPAQRNRKGHSHAARIKQGSANEEAALVAHLRSLAPVASVLAQAGQLAELLCLLGQFDDARTLQQHVGAWQASAVEAEAVVQDALSKGLPTLASPSHDTSNAMPPWKWEVLRAVQQ